MNNTNPYQFTGRENDGTGLYFYRARYYSPTFQRFVSQDPIGFAGGGPNLYGYVLNNPISFIDPFGYQWLPTPTPSPTPSLDQVLQDAGNPLNLFSPNTPTGEPAMSCAPPPPPPPQACPGGATPPEQLDPIGIYTGLLGYGGFLAFGPWGAAGGAILGFGTGLWVNTQQLNNCP